MEYCKTIKLKDGRTCILRNCTAEDGKAVLDVFNLTHEQTDWMLTYPGEMTFTVEQEAKFLQDRTDSSDEIEILAEVDGKVVGTAGISCVGRREKLNFEYYYEDPGNIYVILEEMDYNPVQAIPQKRMSDRSKMYADLVRSAMFNGDGKDRAGDIFHDI